MPTRRRAREIVLQLLYEDDLNPEQDRQVADTFLVSRLHGNRPLVAFARELWHNVIKNRSSIDKSLTSIATNWSVRRMAAIDRNVLRLAAFEILMTETPGRVVINEAVELAKRFGNHQSGQFVNGILDRLLHEGVPEARGESGEGSLESQAVEETPSPTENSAAKDGDLASNRTAPAGSE